MLNKKCLITLGLFSFTLLLGCFSLHLMQFFSVSKWVGVSIASGIFVVMLVLTIAFRKHFFMSYIAIPINAFANGIASSSLFVYLDEFPKLWHTAVLFVALCFLFYLYCVLTKFSYVQNHFVINIAMYVLILLAVGITCYVVVGSAVFALALLCLIPFLAYLLLLVSKCKNLSEHIKFASYCSFAVLILVIFAVIVVLSQGEALDGIDGGGGGTDGGKKKKNNLYNPYDYFKSRKK